MNMETKFTPGPWQVGDNGHNANMVTTVKREKTHGGICAEHSICLVSGIWQNHTTDEIAKAKDAECQRGYANARLIAAAPEMFALLDTLAAMVPPTGTATGDTLILRARALLAKITKA